MPKFSESSKRHLETCHHMIQVICNEAIQVTDFKVLQGHRGEAEQTAAYTSIPQRSKLPWPRSKHNKTPSLAVDLAPYPIDWNNKERFAYLAGVIKAIAYRYGMKVTWGGEWGWDYPHFQLEIGE